MKVISFFFFVVMTLGASGGEDIDNIIFRQKDPSFNRFQAIEDLPFSVIEELKDKLNHSGDEQKSMSYFGVLARKVKQFREEVSPDEFLSNLDFLCDIVRQKLKSPNQELANYLISINCINHDKIFVLNREFQETDSQIINEISSSYLQKVNFKPAKDVNDRQEREQLGDREIESIIRSTKNKNEIQRKAPESKTNSPSRLPWIIAGVFLVGILALLLKTFKGKSTS